MKDDETGTNQINMTPLVDVSLTLVLVFMVTMPLSMIHGITVKSDTLKKFGLSTPPFRRSKIAVEEVWWLWLACNRTNSPGRWISPSPCAQRMCRFALVVSTLVGVSRCCPNCRPTFARPRTWVSRSSPARRKAGWMRSYRTPTTAG